MNPRIIKIVGIIIVGMLAFIGLISAVNAQASKAFTPGIAQTQAGQGFTYQGELQNNGSPVNGNCDLQAGLWDAETGGAQVGATQTLTSVVVENGRFTVMLNEGGEFGAQAFTGQARWLETAVRCPAGAGSYATLQPRQPLTAAPYALSLAPGAVISGSVGTGTNAILSLSNFNPNGVGLRIPDSELDSIFIDRAGRHGIYIVSPQQDGIFICGAGNQTDCTNFVYINGIEINRAQGHGIRIGSPGLSGVYVGSPGTNGVDVGGNELAGYFFGAVEITGGCTGCTLANFGVNMGASELRPGDLVILTGSRAGSMDAAPVLMEVTKANGSGGAVLGVVMGYAEEVEIEDPRPNESGTRIIPRAGAAKPGDYVTILTYGLAQVRIDSLFDPLPVGQRLTAGENGSARPLQTVEVDGVTLNEAAPVLGLVLEAGDTDGDGLVWVLVNPQ